MSQPDMAVEGDMMAEVDMSQPDMAEPDMAEPDMAEPDMAEPDMAEPDMGGDACEALIGEPCENNFNEGCCDSMGNAIVLCQAGTFQRINPGDELFCNCFGEGEPPVEVVCAVPGFVGVHRSGWRPARVLRLRRVA